VSFCVSIQIHLLHLSASSRSLARPMSTIPSFKLIVQKTGWLLRRSIHGCGSCRSWRRNDGARSTAPRLAQSVVTPLVHPSLPALLALAPCRWRAALTACRAHRAHGPARCIQTLTAATALVLVPHLALLPHLLSLPLISISHL
jgi:hypothetical protein